MMMMMTIKTTTHKNHQLKDNKDDKPTVVNLFCQQHIYYNNYANLRDNHIYLILY